MPGPRERAKWMRVDRLLGEMRIPKDSAAGRRECERQMEARRQVDDAEGLKVVRRGWSLGDEEFRQELLEQMSGKIGHQHGGREKKESAEQRAQKIVGEELKRRGWDRKELKRRKKGDRAKAELAGRLRRETTMGWKWIASCLRMGAAGYAAACVREFVKPT